MFEEAESRRVFDAAAKNSFAREIRRSESSCRVAFLLRTFLWSNKEKDIFNRDKNSI
jgi:hypothetical protein